MNEKLYQVALELIPKIGDVTAKNLIAYCGSASAVFTSKKGHLQKIPGIGDILISKITGNTVLNEAEKIINDAAKLGISIHHFTDRSYPSGLKQVPDAPNIIYSKGQISDFKRLIGIVGTRNATDYGRMITEKIVTESSELGATIVSGLAYGIDITSHRQALKLGTPTIAVLAGGLDKIYPREHKRSAEEMQRNGGIISEHPAGVMAEAHFFPARNRIIAGMVDAVIVVEAARKGGALITGNIAFSYDKPVFAVPGDLSNKYSEGCNYLIRNQKAYLYTGVQDLKYHLNWDETSESFQQSTEKDLSSLSDVERSVYQVLKENSNGLPIDELAWKAQVSINRLASLLLNLEFTGLVKSLPGKRYRVN